jgi:hypothetical protein
MSSDLVGTWLRPAGSTTQSLILNADGSGSIDNLKVKWQLSGDTLSLSTPSGAATYHVSVSGDSLTASGDELPQPLVYRRAKPNGAASPLAGAADSDDGLPVAGTPPLTRELVNKETQCLEWLLDAHLTLQQRSEFQDGLVTVWNSHQQDAINGYLSLGNVWEQVSQKSPEEQEVVRESVRSKLLAFERQNLNDPFAQWVVGVYDSAHPPIAAGNPPLTAQVVDAYADLVAFMVNECAHRPVFKATRQIKDQLARSLAREYPAFSAQQQNSLSQMPFLWKELSLMWPRLSEGQRETFRQQWTPMIASLASGGGTYASGAASPASSGDALQNYFDHNSEHQFVQSMSSSSFNTTMSLHMNMWHP